MTERFNEICLPVSGQTVRVSNRRFKVLDNIAAADMVGADLRNPIRMLVAKVALVTSYPTGAKVVYEDLLEWDEDDLAAVMAQRDDPDFTGNLGGRSSGSPDSPTGV